MDTPSDIKAEELLQLMALSQTLGGFAHEIAQPHNAVMIAAQVIQMRVQKTSLSQEEKKYMSDRLGMITSQVSRATELVESFRAFTQPEADEESETELNQAFEKIQGLTSQQMMSRGIEFNLSSQSPILTTNLPASTVKSALILCLAYVRESVRVHAEHLRETKQTFTKQIQVDLARGESSVKVTISWDIEVRELGHTQTALPESTGYKIARLVLEDMGVIIQQKPGSLIMELPST